MAVDRNEAIPEEIERAVEKFRKRDAGIVKAEGESASAHARLIASRWLPVLTDGLAGVMRTRNGEPALRTFFALVDKLARSKLALCLLEGALQGVGRREDNFTDTALHIAENIYIECFGKGLFKGYPKSVAKKIQKKFAKAPRRGRRQVVQELYKTGDWNPEAQLRVGNWGIDQLLELLPGVFTIEERLPYKKDPRSVKRKPEKVVALTPEAVAYAENNVAELIRRNPVWLPKPQVPAKWQDWDKGGTSDHRLAGSLTIVRARNKDTARAVRKAISDGTMKPTLDALNTLQAVPWTINKQVLDALHACDLQSVEVDGVPKDDSADRVMFGLDMKTAEAMAAHERFWTPMNLDWRGRVYGVPSFNFQRDDRVRALFLFADGEPIGEEGLYWLKVHVANSGDFEGADFIRVSKRPFAERTRWVDDNIEKIKATADAWLKELWWTKADKPFQFLAACFELSSALAQGPTFVSRLPISFDGSCSGLQHLSAMTRDEETAKLVNLTPSAAPQDIYETVAEIVHRRVEKDLEYPDQDAPVAQMWLDYGITRKVVKRNVMTYSYGSNDWGMAEQLREDLMRPLAEDVKNGKRKEHPFGEDEGDAAAKYLAKYTYSTIEALVERPAAAMRFLQDLTSAAADHGLSLQWMTPTGFPWINRYYKQEAKQVRLFLHRLGLFRVLLTTGEEETEPKINRRKAKNGVAPNCVHACDAAHLMRTVNAAVAEGITSITTVHDSFGCLPSRAGRFRKIILEQFVRMYETHDVLAEVFAQARADLSRNTKRMPSAPPQYGALDLKKVRDAEFAFA
jgi:DNA-directed RNA polymerase, mitochondrial